MSEALREKAAGAIIEPALTSDHGVKKRKAAKLNSKRSELFGQVRQYDIWRKTTEIATKNNYVL